MAIKNFVLDTNVLIHDPHAIYEFSDNRVIIPIKVIEELDKIKNFHDERARNAREVTRQLDQYRGNGSLSKGAKLPSGGEIKIVLPDKKDVIKGLEEYHPDNEIIITAMQIINEQKASGKNEKVIFVSKDLNARIKADSIGIDTQDFEKHKVVIDELYSGYGVYKIPGNDVDKFYKEKKLECKEEDMYPNQFALLVDENYESHSAIAQYDRISSEFHPLTYAEESIWGIRALNMEQRFAFECLMNDQIPLVSLIGQAGTGKTLIALACGLAKTIDEKKYKKLIVGRPVIPMGKDIGYLPGSKDEKLHFWMQPIFDNLEFIFSESTDNYDKTPEEAVKYIMDRGFLELEALTYIRGRSITDVFVIIDEAQNLTPHEIKTVISRAGRGTKIILTGDPYQIDNPYLDSNSNGLTYSVERLKESVLFSSVTLAKSERSELAALAAEML